MTDKVRLRRDFSPNSRVRGNDGKEGGNDLRGEPRLFSRAAFLLLLLVLWLALSSQHTALITTLGVIGAGLVVWLGSRMEILGARLHTPGFYLRLPRYMIWLSGRVVASCVRVAFIVLHPRLLISPGFIRVPMTQKRDLGKLVHANSITLTPGTLSTRVEEDHIEVHMLRCDTGDEHADLDRRVTRLERESGGEA